MDRSIYTALNSMSILRTNQSVTSQNLANSNSTGFQKDNNTNFSSVYLDRDKGLDPRVLAIQDSSSFDSSQGPKNQTGEPLDLAVDGDGYFLVKPENGKNALSKRGDFKVSANSLLVDGTGTAALNIDLEVITIPPHRKINIAPDGTIEIEPLNAPVGQKIKVGQLATVSGSEVPLAKFEDGFVRTINETVPEPDNKVRLLTGFLEGSNVKTIDELVSNIENSRSYEINVKFITTAKEIDEATASLMRMPS